MGILLTRAHVENLFPKGDVLLLLWHKLGQYVCASRRWVTQLNHLGMAAQWLTHRHPSERTGTALDALLQHSGDRLQDDAIRVDVTVRHTCRRGSLINA